MKCTQQTMWKIGIGVLLVVIVGFTVLPGVRAWILAASPLLLILLCPLSMIFCMKMMNDKECNKPDAEERNKKISPAHSANDKTS
jgi:hypothetical protein